MEPIASLVSGDVDSVVVGAVDLGQRLDEIYGVAFVAPELCADSVSIDCDPQSDRIYKVIKMERITNQVKVCLDYLQSCNYLLLPATEAWASSP